LIQLAWEGEIIEYVDYLRSKLSIHGNAGASAKETPQILDKQVPLLGPQFLPPGYQHHVRRDVSPVITPEQSYIHPITVVHPLFYPTTFVQRPTCLSSNIRWDSWNAAGACCVYAASFNERAIGYQLRCQSCKENGQKGSGYWFAMTNRAFWGKWEL
ncbi:hypothetical protein BDN70DRAFT_766646, partial [Pholiota conissans]